MDRVRSAEPTPTAPLRVVVLDASSIVPYYTAHLCRGLSTAGGVQVWAACITYHHDPTFLERSGIRNDPGLLDLAWRAPAGLRRPLKIVEYLINLLALLARFRARRPDVLHVQFMPLLARGIRLELFFLRLVRRLGIKVVYTVHNVLPQDTGSSRQATYRQVYALADRLICHDDEASGRLRNEFGVPASRISVIPHGPMFEESPTSPATAARSALGLDPSVCLFLWHGILRPYKGISFLLESWRRVCAARSDVVLAIAGSGDADLVAGVERKISELNLGSKIRCDFRFLPIEDLANYFAAADVLVYPYSEITTSGALMTGIVHRKAVVATSLPAFQRVLAHGETALLVPYGDVDALAGSLIKLAGDPGLRRRLGERLSDSQARHPRWPEIACRTRECYREVFALEPGAPGRAPLLDTAKLESGPQ